jgi:hypothetical protein
MLLFENDVSHRATRAICRHCALRTPIVLKTLKSWYEHTCSAHFCTKHSSYSQFEIITMTRTPWAVSLALFNLTKAPLILIASVGQGKRTLLHPTAGLQAAVFEFMQIELSANKKSVQVGTGLDWRFTRPWPRIIL